MSDFSKPVVTDNYATLLPALVTELQALARALDPATTGTHTNMPSGTVRWNSASVYWEKYNGTSWAPLAATYAIGISGNAATATTAASCSGNAATATTATNATAAATLKQFGSGSGMTFNWDGQAGQPTWLWGGSDGVNMYVYNPSNFSVASAAACTGNAATATTAAACSGNAATASTAAVASSCSGNSATASSAAACSGNSATATKAGALGSGGTGGTSLGFSATDSAGTPERVWGSAAGGASATLFTPATFSVANATNATTAANATNLGGVAASGYARSGANTDITSLGAVTALNGGPLAGFRNRIINGNFGVNQRAYASGATVGYGLYGHDRWKMTASGDTYTFSTAANVTTVTVPAGKVLQQVIEGLNLESGTYTLSWTGTAQGKIGAGSYGASGITGSITGGTNTTIEFGPGTVSKVQLEFGSVTTAFEQRPYGLELSLCQRYYYHRTPSTGQIIGVGQYGWSNTFFIDCQLPVPMRALSYTVSASSTGSDFQVGFGAGSFLFCDAPPSLSSAASLTCARLIMTVASGAPATGTFSFGFLGTNTYVGFSAEL